MIHEASKKEAVKKSSPSVSDTSTTLTVLPNTKEPQPDYDQQIMAENVRRSDEAFDMSNNKSANQAPNMCCGNPANRAMKSS